MNHSAEKISVDLIGWKAYGLASLPLEWVPPFFVITASCFEQNYSDETIQSWIEECFAQTAIVKDRPVMVRSSGTSETIRNRGRLKSKSCQSDQIVGTIRNLISLLPKNPPDNVHWVIQEYVSPVRMGHLSNERYLRKEKRDWVVTFEVQEDRIDRTEPIAIRHWRDGTGLQDLNLDCISEFGVSVCLKRVAMWATGLLSRTHFEWVWNGKTIRIVQADESGAYHRGQSNLTTSETNRQY